MKKIKKIQNEDRLKAAIANPPPYKPLSIEEIALARKEEEQARAKALKKAQAENMRRHLELHPELKEAHEARQWAKVGLESFEDDTVSYRDSWWWRRPGYYRGIGLDYEGRWVAITPEYERQRALEKKLSAQGVPDEVIETVLWLNNELAKEPANESHAQQPKPKPKRKSGRQPSIASEEIARSIKILRSHPKMGPKKALQKLDSEGIKVGYSAFYRLIYSRAYDVSK